MDPARLHPQARAALDAQPRVPLTTARLAEVRSSMVEATPAEVGAGPAIETVADIDADGVPVRLYRDGGTGPAPVILFAHGGGWVMGDLDTHDGLCRHLVAVSGWAVLAVEYRLAPEHPYPAAVDDMCHALDWLRGGYARAVGGAQAAAPSRAADRYGLDPHRVAVAGDSAGGQLAAVVARRARDSGSGLAAQILICPVLDPATDYPPLDQYGLDRDEMGFFWNAYAPPPVDRTVPDLNPIGTDLAGLPPAVVITAELDVLRDEGERYAAGLLRAGVPVVAVRYQGLVHNSVRKLAMFDAAHAALAKIAATLRLLPDR
jgi:acetyl esterase